jgi:PAS domain S-box-containing protein
MQRLSRSGAPPQLPGLYRFMIAVGATMVGLVLTGLLAPLLGGAFFLFALAAVALSALYGGLGAGLLATLLAGVGFCFLFLPPIGSIRVQDPRDGLRLVIFLAVSVLMSRVVASVRQRLLQTRTRLAERERVDHELRNAQERAAELLESTSDAFFSLDRRFHVTYLNQEAERVFGRKRETLMGRNLWAEFPEAVGSSFQHEYQGVMETGQPMRFVEFYPPLQAWFEVRAFPTRSGLSVFFRDISEQRSADQALRESEQRYRQLASELEQRVRERTAQLADTNEELKAFSYSVSHDLRAPLRGIDGFCQAVEEDEESTLSPAARSYLERVRRASGRMGQLIDDLLALSRLSRAELRRKPVDLSALAHVVLAELAAQEPQRDVELRVQPELRVDADPQLLRVLLENLLGNAWKFTQRVERPRIELSADRREGRTVYCVRDDGAGFDMKYADKLFTPFQRLHEAKEFPGTGIGLAIVQRVVHRHGGHVWAESAPGQGAAFFFTLEPGAPEGGRV